MFFFIYLNYTINNEQSHLFLKKICYNALEVEALNKLMIKLILWHQKISPNKEPCCGHYQLVQIMAEFSQIQLFKATFLSTKRILTCNPLFKPKYDPVPEKEENKQPKQKIPLANNTTRIRQGIFYIDFKCQYHRQLLLNSSNLSVCFELLSKICLFE